MQGSSCHHSISFSTPLPLLTLAALLLLLLLLSWGRWGAQHGLLASRHPPGLGMEEMLSFAMNLTRTGHLNGALSSPMLSVSAGIRRIPG